MRVFTETLAPNGGQLTGYVLDASTEMPGTATRPAVLVFPGGGYRHCSDREAEPVALAYAARGYNTFVLRYTVGEQAVFPKALEDARAALAYLRANAQQLAIAPGKIAVAGFSAGGHLAASLGTQPGDKPNVLILGYPVILAEMGPMMGEVIPGADAQVSKETPPTFIFSTADDTVVPIENTLAFSTALAKAAVPFEQHIYLTGKHGLSLAQGHTASGKSEMLSADVAPWLGLSVRFLQQLWGDYPVA